MLTAIATCILFLHEVQGIPAEWQVLSNNQVNTTTGRGELREVTMTRSFDPEAETLMIYDKCTLELKAATPVKLMNSLGYKTGKFNR